MTVAEPTLPAPAPPAARPTPTVSVDARLAAATRGPRTIADQPGSLPSTGWQNPLVRTGNDVPYGPHPQQHYDVWEPPGGVTDSRTVVVFVHGGAWTFGDEDGDLAPFPNGAPTPAAPLAEIAARLGLRFVSIDYRLGADTVTAVEMADDVTAAIAEVERRYAPDQVIVAGHSAGGHLATVVAARGVADKLVDLAGPTDLDTLVPNRGCPAGDDPLAPGCLLLAGWDAATGGDPDVSTEMSPVHELADSPLVAAYFVAGELDTLIAVDQLSRAADQLGSRAWIEVVADRGHCDFADSVNLDALADFIRLGVG